MVSLLITDTLLQRLNVVLKLSKPPSVSQPLRVLVSCTGLCLCCCLRVVAGLPCSRPCPPPPHGLKPVKHCPWNGPLAKSWRVLSHLSINRILFGESGELFLWFADLILTLSRPENAGTCPPTQLCLGF